MGIGNRTGWPWKAALLLAVGAAGGGAAIAVASVPDSNGVIHACVSVSVSGTTTVPALGPNVRVIDPSADQSCTSPVGAAPTATALSWNQTGPPGAPGATGPQGPPGTPGKTQTVVGGQTLTLASGQVIRVGTLPTNTINVPAPSTRPSGNTVTMTIDGMTLPILGFSFVNGGASKVTGSGAGRAGFNDFQITRKIDKSSAKLAQACLTGKHFPTATITLRKAGGNAKTYLKYTLTNVIISSYQTGGSGHDVTPSESLSLNFTKIQITYVK